MNTKRKETPRWLTGKGGAGLLLILCVGLYANTLGHEYALDDAIVITENEVVKRGVGGIVDLFTHDTFYGFFGTDEKAGLVAGGRYRPLTPTLFALERSLGAGPFLHHLLNVLWYGGLVLVVFGFVRDLARGRGLPGWFALVVAGLFAAHPTHTEVVANIKGRDEILALLGALGGTWLLWRSAYQGSKLGAAAGAVLIFMGCLAKENAITWLVVVPAVLYLFPYSPGSPSSGRPELESLTTHQIFGYTLPALLAVGLFLALRTAVIGLDFGDPVLELMNNPFLEIRNGNWTPVSTATRLATAFHCLLAYLGLFIAPFSLSHDYYPTAVPLQSWASVTAILGLMIHLAMGAFVLLRLRRFPLIALGLLVYLASISIVSNVLFSVGTLMSERFLFMPSLGLCLASVATSARLLPTKTAVAGYGWAAIIGLFSVLTVVRNPVWQDNYTLFTTDVLKQPDSAKLRNAAAGVRLERYQSLPPEGRRPNDPLLLAALADLNRALAIHPTYKNAFLLRGNANLLAERYDPAIADYDRALDLDGGYTDARANLLLALTRAAKDAGEARGNIQAALTYLKRAEQLDPNDYEMLRLSGVAYGVSGNNALALSYFKRALDVNPSDKGAMKNYATALYQSGRTGEAEEWMRRAGE